MQTWYLMIFDMPFPVCIPWFVHVLITYVMALKWKSLFSTFFIQSENISAKSFHFMICTSSFATYIGHSRKFWIVSQQTESVMACRLFLGDKSFHSGKEALGQVEFSTIYLFFNFSLIFTTRSSWVLWHEET